MLHDHREKTVIKLNIKHDTYLSFIHLTVMLFEFFHINLFITVTAESKLRDSKGFNSDLKLFNTNHEGQRSVYRTLQC